MGGRRSRACAKPGALSRGRYLHRVTRAHPAPPMLSNLFPIGFDWERCALLALCASAARGV